MILPLVSIVIPFYSNKNWLIIALESVLNQTYKNYEVIIVNDGSDEDISDLTDLEPDKVKVLEKENGGPSTARNFGVKYSKGKYIAFLDSDDYWTSDKLSKQVEYMEKTNCKWSQHSYTMFWDETERQKIIDTSKHKGDVYKDLFVSFKCQTSTFMFDSNFLRENKLQFPIDKRFGQDVYYFMEAAKIEKLGYVDGNYSFFRIRGNNAGFRAAVQLKFRSDLYSIILNDDSLQELLPKNIILAYKISRLMNTTYEKLFSGLSSKSNNTAEIIARLFYLFPYLLFKIN